LIERNNDEHVSTGMLDHIIVETSGLKMPLNWLVVVSVLDQKTLQRYFALGVAVCYYLLVDCLVLN